MSLFIVYFGLVYCLHFKYSLHYYLKADKVLFFVVVVFSTGNLESLMSMPF